MLHFFKRLWKKYKKFTVEQYNVAPVVYKIGTKKYIKKKQFSKSPVHRTRYQK